MTDRRPRWRTRAGVVALAVGGLLLLAAGVGFLPRLLYNDPQTAEAQAVFQAGLLTAMAGLLAFAGALLTVRETRRANDLAAAA